MILLVKLRKKSMSEIMTNKKCKVQNNTKCYGINKMTRSGEIPIVEPSEGYFLSINLFKNHHLPNFFFEENRDCNLLRRQMKFFVL